MHAPSGKENTRAYAFFFLWECESHAGLKQSWNGPAAPWNESKWKARAWKSEVYYGHTVMDCFHSGCIPKFCMDKSDFKCSGKKKEQKEWDSFNKPTINVLHPHCTPHFPLENILKQGCFKNLKSFISLLVAHPFTWQFITYLLSSWYYL